MSKGIAMRPYARLLVAALSLLGLAACGKKNEFARTLHGDVPPELATTAVTWLNTDAPLSLSSLRGKVVYLEFGFRG